MLSEHHTRKETNEIEQIQCRATKLAPTLKDKPYEDRLKAHRRRWGDMIQVYKINQQIYHLDQTLFFTTPTVQNTRGHSQTFFKKTAKKTLIQLKNDRRLELPIWKHNQPYTKNFQK